MARSTKSTLLTTVLLALNDFDAAFLLDETATALSGRDKGCCRTVNFGVEIDPENLEKFATVLLCHNFISTFNHGLEPGLVLNQYLVQGMLKRKLFLVFPFVNSEQGFHEITLLLMGSPAFAAMASTSTKVTIRRKPFRMVTTQQLFHHAVSSVSVKEQELFRQEVRERRKAAGLKPKGDWEREFESRKTKGKEARSSLGVRSVSRL